MKLYFCPLWQWGPFCPRYLSPNVWKSHSCKGAGSPFHFVNIIYMITSFILIPFSSFTQLLFYITFSAVLYFIRRSSRKSVKTSNMQIHQGLISKYGMALNKKEFWMIWKEMRYAKFLTLTMIMHIWHWGWKIQQYCLKEYCCFGVIIHIACLIVLIIILINVLVKMLMSTRWWFRHSMSGWISLHKMTESSSLSLTSRWQDHHHHHHHPTSNLTKKNTFSILIGIFDRSSQFHPTCATQCNLIIFTQLTQLKSAALRRKDSSIFAITFHKTGNSHQHQYWHLTQVSEVEQADFLVTHIMDK